MVQKNRKVNYQTNCENCGAPLSYKNMQSNILKCEYCKTEYFVDSYGELKGQYIVINRGGELKRFYIASEEINTLYRDAHRDTFGNLIATPICAKTKLTLVEI